MLKKRANFKGRELSRTIGIEVEGYTNNFNQINRSGVRHAHVKRDASLLNSYYDVDYSRPVGLEIVSVPLAKLDMLDEMFTDIRSSRWATGVIGAFNTAGTHVHVDASDFTLTDKIRMATFMQKIENVMFLLVKESRLQDAEGERNRYCCELDNRWGDLVERANKLGLDVDDYGHVSNLIYDMANIMRNRGERTYNLPNSSRYQFVNIFNTDKPTIEFRLFHAIRSSQEAKKFATLSYNLIQTVKYSTTEQLDFIVESVKNARSAEEMVERLSVSIGLDFVPKIHNKSLERMMNANISMALAV